MNKIGRMQKRIIGCITDSASSTTSPLQFISNLASDRLEHAMTTMVMVTIVWTKSFPKACIDCILNTEQRENGRNGQP